MPCFYKKSYVIDDIYDGLIQKPQLSHLPKNMTSPNTEVIDEIYGGSYVIDEIYGGN